jgi:hypothetical protein
VFTAESAEHAAIIANPNTQEPVDLFLFSSVGVFGWKRHEVEPTPSTNTKNEIVKVRGY